MWELDCEESWAPKNWCFWTVVLEKTLESLLDCKEIQPVHPKDQSWMFFGRTGAKAETPVLWPPHAKNWLIGKDPDAGRDWGQEEKGMTEDEMAGRHYRLNGREFEWTPGDGDGQGGLACCDSWGRRVRRDWATELNWLRISNPKVYGATKDPKLPKPSWGKRTKLGGVPFPDLRLYYRAAVVGTVFYWPQNTYKIGLWGWIESQEINPCIYS